MNTNEASEAIANIDGDVEIMVFETSTVGQQIAGAAIQVAVGLAATVVVGAAFAGLTAGAEKIREIRANRKAAKALKAEIAEQQAPQED